MACHAKYFYPFFLTKTKTTTASEPYFPVLLLFFFFFSKEGALRLFVYYVNLFMFQAELSLILVVMYKTYFVGIGI